jgi:micrococcal nuclease
MIIVPETPPEATAAEYFRASVEKVFDGDGFLAKVWNPIKGKWIDGVPFRFAFIDAPEMEQPGGREAMDFLDSLIGGKELRLDPVGKESSGFSAVDAFRRVLCTAYITEPMKPGPIEYYHQGACGLGTASVERLVTRNVELEMVINGWAWIATQYDFDRRTDYLAAQDDAKCNRRGLWAQNNPEAPWSFKRRQRQRAARDQAQGRLI